jgi:CBS domain-containing protein
MADVSVRTLVHRLAVDVPPDASLRSVAETLNEEEVGIAIVRRPHPPGHGTRAAGLVSERDIVRALAEGMDPDDTGADDVMTGDLASVAPHESIRLAAQRMIDNDIRHLPVIEGEDVVGVISMRDVLRVLLESADEPAR